MCCFKNNTNISTFIVYINYLPEYADQNVVAGIN